MSNILSLKQLLLAGILIINLIFCLPSFSWAAEDSDMILASRWIDREIFDKNGDHFGEIDDLIIKRSGKVKKVTIEIGGFLNVGDKLVAVSLGELRNLMAKDGGKMVLNTTEEQLEKREDFNYLSQGLHPDYYYRIVQYGRYGYRQFPPPYYYNMPYGPGIPRHRRDRYPASEPDDWVFSPARFLASVIMNRRVVDEDGNIVGRVTDLLIDTRDARVKKILLTARAVRGDSSPVAIPYEPPGFTAYGLVLDISRNEIDKLPGYRFGN